jgi:hypothetical protein
LCKKEGTRRFYIGMLGWRQHYNPSTIGKRHLFLVFLYFLGLMFIF